MLVFVERSTKFPSASEFCKRPTHEPHQFSGGFSVNVGYWAIVCECLCGVQLCIWVNFEKYTTVTADS